MMKHLLFLLATSVSAGQLAASPLATDTIKVCGDGAGWPPYHFKKEGSIQGYDVDVLGKIFTPHNIKFKVTMPPWKRCLSDNKHGHYHISLSASLNPDRIKNYLVSRVYYILKGKYFFFRQQDAGKFKVESPKDLLNYNVCGLRGYNYDGFGIKTAFVDRNANNFTQLIRKTKMGRCDMFLARHEVLQGFQLVGKYYIDPSISHAKIPGISGDRFHMLISRKHPHAEELLQLINSELDRLDKQGTLDQLLNNYLQQ